MVLYDKTDDRHERPEADLSRPEPHEWAEVLCRHRHGLAAGPACEYCYVAAETLVPLITRTEQAAREEGMAAVAGPVLALADWWARPTSVYLNREVAHRTIRVTLPTDAAEALARVRAKAKTEALREAADALDDHTDCDCEPGDHLTRLAGSKWLRARAAAHLTGPVALW